MKTSKLIVVLIVLSFLVGCNTDELIEPVDPSDQTEYDFTVPSGASTSKIGTLLEESGLVQKAYAFRAAVERSELDGKLQAGDYKLKKSMSAIEIAKKIADGDIYLDTFKFTIPEGYEFIQIVDTLAEQGRVDKDAFIDLAENYNFDYRFLEDDRVYEHRLEGFLYPATYEMLADSDELAILTKLLDTFDMNFESSYYERAEELGYTVSEIVTLASVIEREAVVNDELKLISEVFHNRLNDDYLLQADSTIQYITKERKERMTLKDVAVDNPYNTYVSPGLPPSPICNPSQLAIEAALYPEIGNLYYFVVTGNNDGRHNFAETYAEHLKNQREAEAKLDAN